MPVKNKKTDTVLRGQPKAVLESTVSQQVSNIFIDENTLYQNSQTDSSEQQNTQLSENLADQEVFESYVEQKLNEKGVGTKPCFLLINEFIPLKAANLENVKDLNEANINFSKGDSTSVTNTVRLIELQNILNKQINKISSDYIVKNSPKVSINLSNAELSLLKEAIHSFYIKTRKHLNDNFTTYFFNSLTKTQLIEKIKEGTIEASITTQSFLDNLDPDFLYSLLNLIVNDIFIFRVNKTSEVLASLKRDHNNTIDFLKIIPESFNTLSETTSVFFKEIQDELKSRSGIENNDLFFKKYFLNTDNIELSSINKKNSLSEYLNLNMKLLGDISFFDSITSIENDNRTYDYTKAKLNSYNDLYDAIKNLKEIKFPNLISRQNRVSSNKSLDELTSQKINQILEGTNEQSKSKQLAEILSAICFDHVGGANKVNKEIFKDIDNITAFSESAITYIDNNLFSVPNNLLNIPPSPLSSNLNVSDVSSVLGDNRLIGVYSKLSNGDISTIGFENENVETSNIYPFSITHDSYDYFVLRDLIINKNKQVNLVKDYLNNHKANLKKIVKTLVRAFSLGFDDLGLNKSANKVPATSSNNGRQRALVNDSSPAEEFVRSTSFEYSLGNLNPMSFLNYYLETLAKDLTLSYIPGGDQNSVSLSVATQAGLQRKELYNLLIAAYAGKDIEKSISSFKASFLGTLSESNSIYLYENGQNTIQTGGDSVKRETIIKDIGKMLNNETYKNFSDLVLGLFNSGDFSTVGPSDGNDYAYLRSYEENVTYSQSDDYNQSSLANSDSYETFPSVFFDGRILNRDIKKSDNTVTLTSNNQSHNSLDKIYFPQYKKDSGIQPGIKEMLQTVYKFMPSSTKDNTTKLYRAGYDDMFDSEDIESAGIENTLFGIGEKSAGNGINITKQSNLSKALLFNYAVLNNANLQNDNLKFPNTQNIDESTQKKLIKGKYFKSSVNEFSDTTRFAFKASAEEGSGGVLNTSNLHLYLIFHIWSLNLINKTLHVELGTTSDRPFIKFSYHRLRGLISALRNNEIDENENQDFKDSFTTAKRIIDEVKQKIIKRNKIILKSVFPLYHQIEKINKYLNKLNSTIGNIPDNILTDMQNFLDGNNFNLPFSINSIRYANIDYQKSFVLSKDYFPMPVSNLLEEEKNDLKIMYKIFTTPGKGFFKEKINTNKKIYHVGISNLLYRKLQIDAGEESNLICIIVKRHNQININEKSLPKYFVFDMSKHVLPKYYNDQTKETVVANHIKNYTDDTDFNGILSEFEYLEMNQNIIQSAGIGSSAFTKNTNLGANLGNYTNFSKNKIISSLEINHILDYYLKLYTKSTIEIDCNESNYPLRKDIFGENTIDNFSQVNTFNQRVINSINNTLEELTDENENIQQQISRVKKNIVSCPVFNSQARAENNIYNTSCFERTFSFLIDEENFLLEGETGEYTFDGRHVKETQVIADETNKNSIYSFTIEVGLLKRW